MTKNEATVKPTSKTAVRPGTSSATKSARKPAAKVVAKAVKPSPAPQKGAKNKAPKEIAKPKKDKVIRDSFTMPESEYEAISAIKRRCIVAGLPVKKSEVLRASLITFAAQSDDDVRKAIGALAVIKTGRPPKNAK